MSIDSLLCRVQPGSHSQPKGAETATNRKGGKGKASAAERGGLGTKDRSVRREREREKSREEMEHTQILNGGREKEQEERKGIER